MKSKIIVCALCNLYGNMTFIVPELLKSHFHLAPYIVYLNPVVLAMMFAFDLLRQGPATPDTILLTQAISVLYDLLGTSGALFFALVLSNLIFWTPAGHCIYEIGKECQLALSKVRNSSGT